MELSLTQKDMERVIEALLFTSSEPLSIRDLKRNLPQNADIDSIIETLQKHYETRGVNLNASVIQLPYELLRIWIIYSLRKWLLRGTYQELQEKP